MFLGSSKSTLIWLLDHGALSYAEPYCAANLTKDAGTVPGYSTSKITNNHSTIINPSLAIPACQRSSKSGQKRGDCPRLFHEAFEIFGDKSEYVVAAPQSRAAANTAMGWKNANLRSEMTRLPRRGPGLAKTVPFDAG
jgi:hypothetical protein